MIIDALIIYAVVVALVFIFQRRLQYFPYSRVERPEGEAYAELEEVTFEAADGVRLKAWYWPGAQPTTLVIFHGNAGNRMHRLMWMDHLRALGCGVFVLDYRGYGGSEGRPTEPGLYLDAEAAHDWLRERTDGPLVYVGESLGGGVAVELACRRPPAAMILHSAFTSATDVARSVYWFLPVRLLLRDRYENLRKIDRVRCPILFVHGEADRVIAPRFGRRLFAAAAEPKSWYSVAGGGHNDLIYQGGHAYFSAVGKFLRNHGLLSR